MRPADLQAARRLQHVAGWNQTLADWEVFLRSTPDGCFVAVDEKAADAPAAPGSATPAPVIGTATSIRYGAHSCWISMVIVRPDFRGRGIASELMRTVIRANEEKCACLRLDATPAGRPVYEKLGFRADYDIERWVRDGAGPAGAMNPAGAVDLATGAGGNAPRTRASESGPHSPAPGCRPLTREDLPALRARDVEVFDGDRSAVLEHLLASAPQLARCIPDGDHLRSYVLGRAGEKRSQIGPIVAATGEDAVALFEAALAGAAAGPGHSHGVNSPDAAAGDAGIVIDIVAGHAAIRDAVTRAGFVFQRPFTRMTRGGMPGERLDATVAIAGPEFG